MRNHTHTLRNKINIKPVFSIFIALLLLIIAGSTNKHLNSLRHKTQNSPHVANRSSLLPVLFSGFRGLAVDILWLRAADLQENGKYFELVQLSEWITALEPHITQVWAVQAWNMAYNISITTPDYQARWGWVKNAIDLLRDQGIPLNSQNPHLYSELALLFLNKIGNPSEKSAQYFKRQWAKEMMDFVGESGFPDYSKLTNSSNSYKLIPKCMQEIDNIYGPLDWRIPQTHALYWAYLGNKAGGSDSHDPRCERIIYQSMAAMFEYGKLTYSKQGDIFVTSTNLELLPKVINTFENAVLNAKDDLPSKAYANFLKSAIKTLIFYHHNQKAHELFEMLNARFPSKLTQLGFDKFTKLLSRPTFPQILAPSGNTTE